MQVFKSEKLRTRLINSYDALLAMWDVAVEERDLETRHGTTHLVCAGDPSAPTLLMFHGVGDNSACMWLPNIHALSKEFYCITVDTLGGPGKSVPGKGFGKGFSQELWISDVIDAVCTAPPMLLGISNGAYMAYNFASLNPERIERLVCLEGGMVARPGKAVFDTLRMMFPEILWPSSANMEKILLKMCHPDSRFVERYPEVAAHMVLAMKAHKRSAMFVHKLRPYNPEQGKQLRGRTLFLLGEHAAMGQADLLDVLRRDGYAHVIVPGAGHGINHEQPDPVNRAITDFLLRRR